MFASAWSVVFPGTQTAPPMMMSLWMRCGRAGSWSRARAMFVSGPIATTSSSPACTRDRRSSISGPVSSGGVPAPGRDTSPTPLPPWTWGAPPRYAPRSRHVRADGDRDAGTGSQRQESESLCRPVLYRGLDAHGTGADEVGVAVQQVRQCQGVVDAGVAVEEEGTVVHARDSFVVAAGSAAAAGLRMSEHIRPPATSAAETMKAER